MSSVFIIAFIIGLLAVARSSEASRRMSQGCKNCNVIRADTRTEGPSTDAPKSAELELLSDPRWRLMGVIAALNQREGGTE
jgi:hypothetical protein